MTDSLRKHLADAHAARGEGDFVKARSALELALALSREDGALIAVLKSLAQLDRDEQILEPALRHYQEAVLVCRRSASAELLAHTLRHPADVHRALDQLNEAELLYQEALRLSEAPL